MWKADGMRMPGRPVGRRTLAAAVAALLLPLGACSEDGNPATEDKSPEEVFAAAAQQLDDTSGVRLSLRTDNLPAGINAIKSAEGVAVHPDGFEGDLGVVYTGQPVSVPVVATGGKTWVILPFTDGYQVIVPADYGAPDPGGLLERGAGFSAMLTGTTEAVEGNTVRGGANNNELLTTYTGTVPADLVKVIVPQATGEFDVTYSIDDEGRLRSVTATGQFYPDVAKNTYLIDFDEYDVTATITPPEK